MTLDPVLPWPAAPSSCILPPVRPLQYIVIATEGHVRHLPARNGAVDPTDAFRMEWEPIARAVPRMTEIARALQGCDDLILATDPGEATGGAGRGSCNVFRAPHVPACPFRAPHGLSSYAFIKL